jgi:hypothetical protein
MRNTLVGVVMAVLLALAGIAAAPSVGAAGPQSALLPLSRIHRSVGLTEAAGSAHFSEITQFLEGSFPPSADWSVGDLTFPGPDVTMTVWGESGGVQVGPPTAEIIVGDEFYVNPSFPPSGTWISGPAPEPYPFLGPVNSDDLEHVRGPVRTIGPETVDGGTTTEYAVHLPGRHKTIRLDKHTLHMTARPFELELWLDPSGRIVQTAAHEVLQEGGLTIQDWDAETLSDFGEPVTITPPPSVSGEDGTEGAPSGERLSLIEPG